jgi:hypothetical protein
MFDKKSIYKITDDRGNVIFWNKINLINTKELRDKISITKLPLPFEPKCREGISTELCNTVNKIFLYGGCSFLVYVFFVPK